MNYARVCLRTAMNEQLNSVFLSANELASGVRHHEGLNPGGVLVVVTSQDTVTRAGLA